MIHNSQHLRTMLYHPVIHIYIYIIYIYIECLQYLLNEMHPQAWRSLESCSFKFRESESHFSTSFPFAQPTNSILSLNILGILGLKNGFFPGSITLIYIGKLAMLIHCVLLWRNCWLLSLPWHYFLLKIIKMPKNKLILPKWCQQYKRKKKCDIYPTY